jgi:hypothetical protein
MNRTGGWSAALAEGLALLAVVWTVPVAIVLVVAPLALTIAAVLWVARLVRGVL